MDTGTCNDENSRRRRGGSRKKTGCATCKARHTRCDEKTPTCGNCERLSLDCRPSEFISHSTWSSAIRPSSTTNQTGRCSASASPTSGPSLSIRARINKGPRQKLHSLAPSDSSTTILELRPPPTLAVPLTVGLQDEAVRLLTIFRGSLATWMDIFDFNETYQREVCRRALSSYLVLYSICAITAKYLSLLPSAEVCQPTASRYYGEALQQLITALSCVGPDTNGDVLTASILLGSYEVISASRAPHYSHYQGSMYLIRSGNISATSSGMNRANFFIYVRHEITIALAREKLLQFDPKDWNMPPHPPTGASEDEMGNYLLWLSGSVINLIYSNNAACSNRRSLIDRVDNWYSLTTETLRGVSYGGSDEEGLQKLFFAVPAAGELPLPRPPCCGIT
ncbi:hypothetical protein F4859DRAFT_377382 [Xylaria cf. heliscus]|nr:hypothetical protein F4859DRAFT_377382 [Xylaria cf. heliscus]